MLWYSSFNYQHIWLFVFKAKFIAFFTVFIASFIFLYANYKIAKSVSRKIKAQAELVYFKPPFQFLNQWAQKITAIREDSTALAVSSRAFDILFKLGLVFIALIFGLLAKSWWEQIYLYFNQVGFQITDPVFFRDISFYVFSLPFFQKIQFILSGLAFMSLLIVCWIYFLQNILLFVFANSKNTGIKKHVFILLSLLCLSNAFKIWLSIQNLLYSKRGIIFGAGYTDINAQKFALSVLCILFIVEAVLLLIWAFRTKFLTPIYFLGFIMLFWLLGGKFYPSFMQNYIVTPNELGKEKPYIEHNISYTRQAFGLDKIAVQEYPVKYNLTTKDIEANANTINNVRLWNQEPLKQTFIQLQEIRPYYEFVNIDVDRYMINNHMQQVMLSARELETAALPARAQSWVNKHLVYTHGYGAVMSPVNEVTTEGLPYFYLKDFPPKSSVGLNITRPEIYFGEKTIDYILVNTKQDEFNYPKGETNEYTQYQGQGGIALNSIWKRLIYALKFSDMKILISSLITPQTRVLYDRDIRYIAQQIAPFLIYDRDPYLVITEKGRFVWMLDAYTSSSMYPYSEPYKGTHINYIRNSVKIVIDAYNGSTNFYIADEQDPIIAAYAKIYQNLFKPLSAMPQDIKQHIRYPKDLFSVQVAMYSTYHMTDPQVFYNKEDLWEIPYETYDEKEKLMEPYYMVTRLPQTKQESFILMLPLTPTKKSNMIAWMSAKCDPDEYGRLLAYRFPKDRTIYGPMQIESRIDQNTDISQKLTLWGQVGSRVIRGNLMVIPIEESLIYIEPVYLQATVSKLPELKRVIFAYNDDIVMRENLSQSIQSVFSNYQSDQKQSYSPSPGSTAKDTNPALKKILHKLINEYQQLKGAAKKSNWLDLGQSWKNIDQLIGKLGKFTNTN